ncbi:hypothetical protein [Paenibacillus sp. SN-8-1]|uniref:hypothetical protein n=1 Tax=Paenibacillus sp. SN-8-1 TaxID=3435409 RepID=UPI003D9AB392
MRKMTLQDVQSKVSANGAFIHLAVAKFRDHSRETGWEMSRIQNRSADEQKALNYIARSTLRSAMKSGIIQYNKESRVLLVEQYSRR